MLIFVPFSLSDALEINNYKGVLKKWKTYLSDPCFMFYVYTDSIHIKLSPQQT